MVGQLVFAVTLFPYTTLFRSCSRTSATVAAESLYANTSTTAKPSRRQSAAAGATAPCTPGTPASERARTAARSEEHTSELQSLRHLVCRLLLEKKKARIGCLQ